jgi:hypothetical protein
MGTTKIQKSPTTLHPKKKFKKKLGPFQGFFGGQTNGY